MVISPRIRNNICLTAHPEGCAAEVHRQIDYVKKNGRIEGTKSALIIGSSTGYGLACRIAAAFGCGAATIGVFFEKEGAEKRPGTPGYYNMKAFDKEAADAGLFSKSINGDAFSNELKYQTIEAIKEGLGKVDLVIYSLASGVRVDPADGTMYRSSLKPIGGEYRSRALDTMSGKIITMEIGPASEEEISNTEKVMGGEDWQLWIDALLEADVLSEGVKTSAFSYIGPDMTMPIYRNGTIGNAKKHLEATAQKLDNKLAAALGGSAFTSVNKALVTRAAAVIPAISLYISILFRVMKDKNIHEGCIEQMDRFFRGLYKGNLTIDDENRVRMDDWEMREDVQAAVDEIWNKANDDNIEALSDIEGYHADFMNMHGFEVPGVDYEADVDPR
ncbi:MAG: trans-2-enoyl-CoA reductase family protein [Spirochaetales bacterium]|uniref:Trans-2-enoyl-CoA reductase [NADH] n=1 Tax=Candidatus Thalassospirochaeta sargassi TaxID=3119039 RepID=A0AAJ1MK68_9SPIO|nr:trans-2-enoyl-CoA reductase family protein [Spirochaetales bacterium]